LPGLIVKLRFPKKVFWIGSVFLFPPRPKKLEANPILHYFTQKPIYWLIKRLAEMIFVTNEGDREIVLTDTGWDKKRVVAVRGGVDLAFIKKIPDQPKKYLGLFIGRIHRHKGILELMDIWRLVVDQKRNAKLAVLGEGPLEEELKAKIKKLRLQDNVELFGFIDGKRKYEIIKSCQVFLHSSVTDSGGMTGAETMAAGLPNVGYDLPAFKTYYPQGMLKAPIGDQKAFAKLILKLNSDPKLYEKTKKEALSWAKGWDWDDNSSRVLNLILKNLKKGT
jgi:glycosyltransferase involved in cell wall biosynthesis